MARINATVWDEHMEQLETVKEEADGEISDAEATRRIFDRAAHAQELAQDLRDCEQEVRDLRAELEQERATRGEEIAQAREELREEYENEIEHLENQIDRLQRTNLKILEQRDRNTDLEVYVDRRREWEEANWLTRQKWKLFGRQRD